MDQEKKYLHAQSTSFWKLWRIIVRLSNYGLHWIYFQHHAHRVTKRIRGTWQLRARSACCTRMRNERLRVAYARSRKIRCGISRRPRISLVPRHFLVGGEPDLTAVLPHLPRSLWFNLEDAAFEMTMPSHFLGPRLVGSKNPPRGGATLISSSSWSVSNQLR